MPATMNQALPELHQDLRDLVGQVVAKRYRVDSLLGVGGMAAVFRAHHLGLKRDVALKILHPNLTANPEISARFDREAESASRLDHPNTVQVTDFGSTEKGIKFMVMQLLEGRELSTSLGGPIGPLRAVELSLQVLRGLQHAHKQGVIHRDVKPENVFVTRDIDGREVLKLVDFGISKMLGGDSSDGRHKTTAGLVFGTPAYMSPEQAAGMEADARADLYSVGVMLYQMLAGRLPFDSDDMVALVRMQVGRDPDPLPGTVPPVLAAVVERLLAKDREERFQTATEVIETLEDLIPILDGHSNYVLVDVVEGDDSDEFAVPHPATAVSSRPPLAVPGPMDTQPSGLVANGEPAPPEASATRGRWLVLPLAGILVAGVAAFLGTRTGDADTSKVEVGVSTRQTPAVSAPDGEPVLVPDAAAIAKIDELVEAKQFDLAEELLKPLRDEFPDDATLMWRQGILLAKNKRKKSQALAAYRNALSQDPALLANETFAEELHELMQDRRVRDEALDLALRKMGRHGHEFLLELVNDQRHPLAYHDRRRALEELEREAQNIPRIDKQLNMALDLMQASRSLTPCLAYKEALDAIAAAPDEYFLRRVEKAKVPTEPGPGLSGVMQEDPESCAALGELREELLQLLTPPATTPETESGTGAEEEEVIEIVDPPPEDPPEEPKKATKPKTKPRARSKRKSAAKKRDCRRPGSKKCR